MPRPPKISREQVLGTALELVDNEGLNALSMRRLGELLGVEAMALYRHVPNKEAVLDGVHEAVLQEMHVPPPQEHWAADLERLALSFRATLLAHPNAVPLFATRPAVTRGSLAYVERALTILSEPYPVVVDRIRAFQSLAAYVVGQTMLQLTSRVVAYDSLPADEFPSLVEASLALANYHADDEFRFGLEALLRGLSTSESS